MFNRRCCDRQPNFQGNFQPNYMMGSEVIEPTITKCVEKEFFHEVPHVCPIHTHTINRHIYQHTYTPQYSCSEENQIINNDCGSCCNFR